MIQWGTVIYYALKVISWLMGQVDRAQLIQQGRDQEIARAAAAILAKTEYARQLREKIDAMDDVALDAALRDLEPK